MKRVGAIAGVAMTIALSGCGGKSLAGTIRFGSNVTDQGSVTKPHAVFQLGTQIAWVATFSHKLTEHNFDWTVAKIGAGGAEVLVLRRSELVTSPNEHQFEDIISSRLLFNMSKAKHVGTGTGRYVMRYLQSGNLLAQGYFRLK